MKALIERVDDGRRCFTYCGDDRCTCPAREPFQLLGRVSTAFPVLETMCRKIGADKGAAVAAEMRDDIAALRAQSTGENGHG